MGFEVIFDREYPLGKIVHNHRVIAYITRLSRDSRLGSYFYYGFTPKLRPIVVILKTRRKTLIIEYPPYSTWEMYVEQAYQELLARLLDRGAEITFKRAGGGYKAFLRTPKGETVELAPQYSIGALLWRAHELLDKEVNGNVYV